MLIGLSNYAIRDHIVPTRLTLTDKKKTKQVVVNTVFSFSFCIYYLHCSITIVQFHRCQVLYLVYIFTCNSLCTLNMFVLFEQNEKKNPWKAISNVDFFNSEFGWLWICKNVQTRRLEWKVKKTRRDSDAALNREQNDETYKF